MLDVSDYIGIPFIDGGRTHKGCDCMGLTSLIFKEYNIDIPIYDIHCHDSSKISEVFNFLYINKNEGWKEIKTPIEPCLVAFAIDPYMPEQVCHIGVYIGDNRFIHTLEKQGSTVVKLNHLYYRNKIKGFFIYEKPD